MTSSSRILKGSDVPTDLVNWHAPAVEETEFAPPETEQQAPLQDPVVLREQARQEGFEQGRAEGIAAGKAELAEHADLLKRVLFSTARPLQSLEHQFEEELLALVKAIARQLIRRELKLDPSHIISIIREGLAALPVASTDIQVRLHPQDAEVVRELLLPDEDGRPWTLVTDPLMEQGGCRIITNTAQIDSRLDTRLGRVIATMLEDERAARE